MEIIGRFALIYLAWRGVQLVAHHEEEKVRHYLALIGIGAVVVAIGWFVLDTVKWIWEAL